MFSAYNNYLIIKQFCFYKLITNWQQLILKLYIFIYRYERQIKYFINVQMIKFFMGIYSYENIIYLIIN